MTSPKSSSRKIGIGMYVMAWGCVFVLLALFFQDYLSQQQNPNASPASQRNTRGETEIVLQPNRQHHYVATGAINEQPVTFLLDTGATDVVIPSALAQDLQLQAGRPAWANTANGPVQVYSTVIASVSIGDIQLYNIRASINPGMTDDVVLLGMSALKQIEFAQKGELLILRQ